MKRGEAFTVLCILLLIAFASISVSHLSVVGGQPTSGPSTRTPEQTTEADIFVGRVKIGETKAEVLDLLGNPARTERFPPAYALVYLTPRIEVHFTAKDVVFAVIGDSLTYNGLTLTAPVSVEEVSRLVGKPYATKPDLVEYPITSKNEALLLETKDAVVTRFVLRTYR